jgi:FkbM family methyltransferase
MSILDAAQHLRANLGTFQPPEFLPEISYTIEETVADDCYGILEHAEQCSNFLDIGANLGIVSRAYRRINRAARIVALEPHPFTARHLIANTKGENVEVCLHGMGNNKPFTMNTESAENFTPFRAAALPLDAKPVTSHTTFGMSLAKILDQYRIGSHRINGKGYTAIKIDCEGGESALIDDDQSTRALYDLIFTNGGCVGIEIHLGEKYPSFLDNEAVVTEEMWSKWLTNNFPAAWGCCIHKHNPTAKIITFQNFKA